jgi:hypothetical protein
MLIAVMVASFACWSFGFASVQDQQNIRVWRQFVSALKEGRMTEDKIRPYEELRELAPASALAKYLAIMKEKATWKEWDAAPEIHQLDDTVHYLIPLTFDGRKNTFCFTFLLQGDQWYFRHMESITIRLDKIGTLPASKFPDVTEDQKVWIREERRMQAQTDLFNLLAKEKGKDYAFTWFRDGAGYFLEAKTWVPFVPPKRAFILYLCWEQSNLQGNSVTLEKLDDKEALVKLDPVYLKLYGQTSIQQKIGFDDYRKMFETQWQDRALNAGWNLNIEYGNTQCTFRFNSR